MISYLKRKTSMVQITIWAVVAFTSNLVLKLWSVPYIRSFTNSTSFDLSIKGYDHNYASRYINSMSNDIIKFYSYIQIPIDFIFPISTAIFSLLLLARFNKLMRVNNFIYLLPVLCCFFDLAENILIFLMLNRSLSWYIVKTASTFTQLKFITGFAYSLIFIFIFLKIKFQKASTKNINL